MVEKEGGSVYKEQERNGLGWEVGEYCFVVFDRK